MSWKEQGKLRGASHPGQVRVLPASPSQGESGDGVCGNGSEREECRQSSSPCRPNLAYLGSLGNVPLTCKWLAETGGLRRV